MFVHMDLDRYLREFDRRDWRESEAGTIRFAMVGLGWWTRKQTIPAVEASDLCEVTVLVSDSSGKARSVADGVESVVDTLSYEEFHDAGAAESYDAVYVATPNARHREYVETAASLGKDVLCEKPMEATIGDAEAMVESCAEADVTLMIAYRMHTEPAVRRARDLIREGAIGEPALVHGNMSERLLELVPDPNQWRLDPDLVGPGISVMDIGIYPLNTTRFVLDADPVSVQAMMHSTSGGFEDLPDERAAFIVEFEGGVYAACTASQNANLASHLRVTGTEGELLVEPAFYPWQDRGLTLTVDGNAAEIEFEQVDQMTEEVTYFADCLLSGRDPTADGAHGLVDLRTLYAIYEAAGSRATVSV